MKIRQKQNAVILFSSGLDSTTALYYALSKGYKCYCLIFDYGQRHKREIKSAQKIAKLVKADFTVIKLSLPWSKDVLTNKNKKVPTHKVIKDIIPATYVPGRNTLFLSYGLSYAESINARSIFIGANALDYSGYPDCRPEFIKAYNGLLKSLGLKITVQAPLVNMTKAQIIKLGGKLKVPYQYTWSCYNGLKKPCGTCDSCKLRAKGFKEAELNDPAI
ncbi:7-cyano-7-deazaguanine synthase QueC [Endomicrobium proavitum]|uniref:7-cyano-7-deazaguanine synthase n=1 Tax=Endomicrobium proavitum TaxID=1408281 RepID=A0A0G3WGA8_9BACT|nr:7-cyano-7-deazaguanine synthase QueC [Endomicrobium proavitum]AKL97383.1 7-cyano-7-deazaguanine synthase [Endomicrobium proavitum]